MYAAMASPQVDLTDADINGVPDMMDQYITGVSSLTQATDGIPDIVRTLIFFFTGADQDFKGKVEMAALRFQK